MSTSGGSATEAVGASLLAALEAARQAANEGHVLAEEALGAAVHAVQRAVATISQMETTFAARPNAGRARELLRQQRELLTREVLTKLDHDRAMLRRDALGAERFTVTLFGRTMAGKSTLMEALTGGDGSSIGKGAQRTTLHAREYVWNDLHVIDVPGIAAFGGEVDDEVAHRAALKADLVLFLINDDNPQPAEATHLVRLRRLGKPVVGVLNVKSAMRESVLEDAEELAYALEMVEARLSDTERLDELTAQFLAITRGHGVDPRIDFVRTHLRARYLAGRAGDPAARKRLLQGSRFADVEERIVDIVRQRGAFLRHRMFVDRVLPSLTHAASVFWQVARTLRMLSADLEGAARDAAASIDSFVQRSDRRIEQDAQALIGGIRADAVFLDRWVEDRGVDRAWLDRLGSAGLDEASLALQRDLAREAMAPLERATGITSRQLALAGLLSPGSRVEEAHIVDFDRARRWAIGIGVAAAAVVAVVVPGAAVTAGWVGQAIGFASFVPSPFDTRAEKLAKATTKLAERLDEHADTVERQLVTHLRLWMRKDLIEGAVRPAIGELEEIARALRTLSEVHHQTGVDLAGVCRTTLVVPLVRRALDTVRDRVADGAERVKATAFLEHLVDAARVPTELALLWRQGFPVPAALRDELERVFEATVHFVPDMGDPAANASRLTAPFCGRRRLEADPAARELAAPGADPARAGVALGLASLLIGLPIFPVDATAPRPTTAVDGVLSDARRKRIQDLVGAGSALPRNRRTP